MNVAYWAFVTGVKSMAYADKSAFTSLSSVSWNFAGNEPSLKLLLSLTDVAGTAVISAGRLASSYFLVFDAVLRSFFFIAGKVGSQFLFA